MPRPPLIPLSVPVVDGNAWRYLKDCLDTGWVSTAGAYVGRFERSVAERCGAAHAVASVNGTAALHLALTALGVGPGDAVLVPAFTFIATANAVTYTGARCLFVDCEPRRFNMDPDAVLARLAADCVRRGGRWVTRRGGLTVKALLPVHIFGYPADLDRLGRLAKEHGLTLLEDAAESLGSTWRGRHTGTFGAAGALSFNGNKVITTGGGGMLLTGRAALAARMRHLSQQAKAGEHEYVHDAIGFNYRLTNIQAALGVAQMERLSSYLARRATVARRYREGLPGVAVEPVDPRAGWNRWLLAVEAADAGEAKRLLNGLEKAGCQARRPWRPVPLQAPYRVAGGPRFPQAERGYARLVNIPSSTALSAADVGRVCRVLRRARLTRLLA